MVGKTRLPLNAMGSHHLALHFRIFAMDMENSRGPDPQLGEGINQLTQLMRGFPFEPERVRGNRRKHPFPSIRIVRDIAVARMPVSSL